ncbi:MAG: putative hydrophobic protein (TIGR00341 family) [Parvibaculaceae bacterium]|jgi:uncharacterized hydrophobic protein (TIGR00341 family)|nr:TIGR00341 family protein [Parvibaculaceae bacterium]
MAKRVVEITAPVSAAELLTALAEQNAVDDVFVSYSSEQSEDLARCFVRMVCDTSQVQAISDGAQAAVEKGAVWHLTILPVEGLAGAEPKKETPDVVLTKKEKRAGFFARMRGSTAAREEIMLEVSKGAQVNTDFLTLVVLSTVVVAVGLLNDNIVAVIGAMVIAPLLGPNLAFAFATALGDRSLMIGSMITNFVGMSLSIFLGVCVGTLWTGTLDAPELLARTNPSYDSIALAIASGGAAVLSLTTGVSSALVGVMVAVALLPPAVACGILLGGGDMEGASGAALLLAINIVCVNLAAQVVFVWKGVRPRTWYEQKVSKAARFNNLLMWFVLLAVLAGLLFFLKP